MRARGFGMVMINGDPAPHMAHVPVLLSEDGSEVLIHLMRSNPIARALRTPQAARIAVQGPDGYISPDWYGLADQVPTWNYVSVQMSGSLDILPVGKLREVLDRQSAFFEARLPGKVPWTLDKMSPEALARMMRIILPCRMRVDDISATWKLGQNKPETARCAAASQLGDGLGQELATLAHLMAEPPEL